MVMPLPERQADMENELIKMAEQLRETEREIFEAIAESNAEALAEQLERYVSLKKQIKLAMIETATLTIPGSEHREVRALLQKLKLGEPLPLEAAFAGTDAERFFRDDFDMDNDEVWDLGSDIFYSWFSHHEYVEGLYNAGTLIAAAGRLPRRLSSFIHEMRQCFVFQQYLAVYSLCRTILELAVREHFRNNDLHDPNSESRIRVEDRIERDRHRRRYVEDYDPDLNGMIMMLTLLPQYKQIKDQLHGIRAETNFLIHGRKDVCKEEAAAMMKQTLQTIHNLYEA